MTLVLLDTNIYLRLAKRIRPLLGTQFGDKNYDITILKDVEDEVHRNSTLSYYYPWFDADDLAAERMAKQVRLSREDKIKLGNAQSVLHKSVQGDDRYLIENRSPPSKTDCRVLAFSQIREAVIVTDDLGMHLLAEEFELPVWHAYELLEKMLLAKVIDAVLIRSIYDALENNDDMTKLWKLAKHTTFVTIFGEAPL